VSSIPSIQEGASYLIMRIIYKWTQLARYHTVGTYLIQMIAVLIEYDPARTVYYANRHLRDHKPEIASYESLCTQLNLKLQELIS